MCGSMADIQPATAEIRQRKIEERTKDIARQSCMMVPRWRFLAPFLVSCIFSEPHAARFRPAS